MQLECGEYSLSLSQPCVMGVLNVTPDSFSDGGRFNDPGRALDQALRLVEAGAAILDIGGESTRPGAEDVEAEEELRRVLPVLKALVGKLRIPISIDTTKPRVMRAAIDAGASMINDVRALREPGSLRAVTESRVALCLMHMQGEPRIMQIKPSYQDVVREVHEFLAERIAVTGRAGIRRSRLAVDPGFGFGKTAEHNLTLLRNLDQFTDFGLPLLVGLSRKSMIGTILSRPVEQRLAGSLALATAAVLKGANIVRAHDVAETVDAVRMTAVISNGNPAGR